MRKINGLECILLIDDDEATSFIHQMTIEKTEVDAPIRIANDGREALEYITRTGAHASGENPLPGLIFLDINMPGMDGWEFLEAYNKLPKELKSKILITMLTTSLNPEDEKRAARNPDLHGFMFKPLSIDKLEELFLTFTKD